MWCVVWYYYKDLSDDQTQGDPGCGGKVLHSRYSETGVVRAFVHGVGTEKDEESLWWSPSGERRARERRGLLQGGVPLYAGRVENNSTIGLGRVGCLWRRGIKY